MELRSFQAKLLKIVSLFFCILILDNKVVAQTTAIPDIIFEQMLVGSGIDTDGQVNGQISNVDAAAPTSLNLSNSNISNLTGIEAFVNLTHLSCFNSQISGPLDLSNNTDLVELRCFNNQITSLSLPSNSTLSTLHCQTNLISTLDLSNNTTITNLNCSTNQISNLNLNNLSALSILICEQNQLTSLDLSTLSSLYHLDCELNQLSSLNTSNNPALNLLHCGRNQITSLDLSNNSVLNRMWCYGNQLTALDVSNNLNLTWIHCGTNLITNLDVSNNKLLYYLGCGYNQITSLDVSYNVLLEYFYCDFNQINSLDVSNNINLSFMTCNDNLLSHLNLQNQGSIHMDCQNNLINIQICVDDSSAASTYPDWEKDATAFYSEACFNRVLEGSIVLDDNTNCLVDSLEMGLSQVIVAFENSNNTNYFITNHQGNYAAYLDTGSYTVSIHTSNPYLQACPPSQSIYVDTNFTLQQLDWVLQPTVLCPLLEVDLSAPILRATGGGTYYTVSYCNRGTADAFNSTIEVSLDPILNVLSVGIPFTNQNGNTYTFNIDTVSVGECGNFAILVRGDTTALIGQVLCSEASIRPDSICIPNYWNGAIMEVAANCQNDTVTFTIDNVGAAMSGSRSYYVFEDNIMMRVNPFFLGAGGSIQITQAATTGKTYRIIVEQELNFPALLGDSTETAFIEGCRPYNNGTFNLGFITQFSNGSRSPFKTKDCQPIRGACDPNEKDAQPLGYDSTFHYIYDYTELDYKVRFQNIGTDTAFNIVILDTISPHLDLSTIKMGAGSHTYNWSIQDGNVLRVSFPNIMLVDSMTNESLSHGFIRYHIKQQPNNPNGTVIYNAADIYFDYNLPIRTNTTWHTIHDDFIITMVPTDKIFDPEIDVKIYPNPFQHSTTIEVQGAEFETLQLSIYDITGRLMRTEETSFGNKIQLSKDNLQPGIYLYYLVGDDKQIHTGKMVVQ